jgi:hypothetical protein
MLRFFNLNDAEDLFNRRYDAENQTKQKKTTLKNSYNHVTEIFEKKSNFFGAIFNFFAWFFFLIILYI